MTESIVPLHINSNVMFAPRNGKTYTKQDAERCFAQQPLPLIPKYLLLHNNKQYKPPTLYLGCIIKKRKLLKIVCRHFSHCVAWVDDRGEDFEDELDDMASGFDTVVLDTHETVQEGFVRYTMWHLSQGYLYTAR
ncbi:hypothetical protein OF83DRAFT_1085969 [Amylostereum chailletii]|nr:hypothetical protein OF83DRAFT_1085969 [Amylostereum chailletii]